MEKERLSYLLEVYSRNAASRDEVQELSQFLAEKDSEALFSSVLIPLMEKHPAASSELAASAHLAQEVLNMDRHSIDVGPVQENKPVHRVVLLRRWWVAASLLLLLGLSIYYWVLPHRVSPPVTIIHQPDDVVPGKNGAVLTLANGTQMVLDSLGNGIIASQQGAQLLIGNGQLSYQSKGLPSGEVAYNTLTTPNGRQFRLVLPDGTLVWLNAGSSITYPTAFMGADRRITVSGEAYFEVAKNARAPFLVNVDNSVTIKVLGTHFNISAYRDEVSINTTLLEGRIQVTEIAAGLPVPLAQKQHFSAVLQPGQQARMNRQMAVQNNAAALKDGIEVIAAVDTAQVMAWKNGAFNFEGASLEEVMRQLQRWYNIRVIYKGEVPSQTFRGGIYRNVPLSDVLEVLKNMGIKWEWDGKTLTIL